MAWSSYTQTSPFSIWTPASGIIFLQVLPTVQNVLVPHSGSCCHLTPTADCIHILAFLFRSRSQVSLIYRTSDHLFLPWVTITFLPYLLVCKIIHFSLFWGVVPCGLWDLNSPNQKLYLALNSESAKLSSSHLVTREFTLYIALKNTSTSPLLLSDLSKTMPLTSYSTNSPIGLYVYNVLCAYVQRLLYVFKIIYS